MDISQNVLFPWPALLLNVPAFPFREHGLGTTISPGRGRFNLKGRSNLGFWISRSRLRWTCKHDGRNVDVGLPESRGVEPDPALGEDDLLDHPSQGNVRKGVTDCVRDRAPANIRMASSEPDFQHRGDGIRRIQRLR